MLTYVTVVETKSDTMANAKIALAMYSNSCRKRDKTSPHVFRRMASRLPAIMACTNGTEIS
jgi:hypothetical protein